MVLATKQVRRSKTAKVVWPLVLVVCLLHPWSAAFAQSGNLKTQRGDPNSRQGLVLETTVVNQGYCRSHNLQLRLLLKYTNVGDTPRILYKHTFSIFRYIVSASTADALKGKHQSDPSLMVHASMPDEVDAPAPNSSFFAILKPKESHTLEVDIHLLINDGKKSSRDFLRPGKHALQLLVGTWYRDPTLAEALATRWREHGILWWHDIKSVPMEFTIKPYNGVIDCYGEPEIGR